MKTILNFKNRFFRQSLSLLIFLSLSLSGLYAMDSGGNKITKEDERLLKEVEETYNEAEKTLNVDELERMSQEIEQNIEKEERDDIRGRNKVLWSIPTAFPEDKFDENIEDLHVNIPFYGKVALDQYKAWHKDRVAAFKESRDVASPLLKDLKNSGDEFHNYFSRGKGVFERHGGDGKNFAALQECGVNLDQSGIQGIYAPGTRLYDYFSGKNLLGLGLYRSDLNEIGFLAANIGSEYLLFRDIKKAKLSKVKEFILANTDLFIDFLEKLQNSKEEPKSYKKIQQEFSSFITNNCSLFIYNPLKKEMAFPVLKYLVIQRVIENIKNDELPYLYHNQDSMFAFVKNEKGELVRSGVTPISLVSVAKPFVAPMAAFSDPSKKTLYKAIQSVKLEDKLFSNFSLPSIFYSEKELKKGLPLKFYWWMSSIVGEFLVLVMSIKIIDKFLNKQLTDSLISKPEELLIALKENKELSNIVNPNEAERELLVTNESNLEKEIERTFSLNKTSFRNWVSAKRTIFGRIAIAGFCCFILPSVVMKGIPLFKLLFNRSRG